MVERVDIGDWCTLYHADGTAIVDTLKAHAPDAVIMDPPYGIGLKGAGVMSSFPAIKRRDGSVATAPGRSRNSSHGAPAIVGDDEGADLTPWLSFQNVFLWGADHLRTQLPDGGRFLAWDKTGGRTFNDDFSDVEFAWHSRKGAARNISHMWKGLCTEENGVNGRRYHPMMKPIGVMEWCIEQCRLEPGDTILDPYMGSGTTAIAAFKRRMKFVGVEIDRRWFDVAVERIKNQTGDGLLFEESAPARQMEAFA